MAWPTAKSVPPAKSGTQRHSPRASTLQILSSKQGGSGRESRRQIATLICPSAKSDHQIRIYV